MHTDDAKMPKGLHCRLLLSLLFSNTAYGRKDDNFCSDFYIKTIQQKLDGSRWETVDGYATACAHSLLLRMLSGERVVIRGNLLGEMG